MQFAQRLSALILFLFGFAITLIAQESSLSGRISDAGSGDGLIGANIVLVGANEEAKGAAADAYGNYEITGIAPGRYALEVSYLGYLKVVKRGFLVGSGPTTGQNFALLSDPDLTLTPIELTFFRNDPVVNPLKREVSLEEVRRLPATFYDPARLLALSPGVVQTNDQANHLSVRGNSPNRNLWRLQGLAIVNPNHTANAGTINDQATLNGGGVNALSAQLLDNSTFYSGGLPAAFGNATAGTLDMRLRPGNTEKARHQVQAGFIGFDLATEGPIAKGKPNTGSYLVNYRYSFTGLLADLGADFGGEEIRFQDVSLHLYQPVGRNGELSVFGLLGNSSNEFTGKDEDFEEDKELFDIDFESQLAIGGLTYEHYALGGKISFGAALSGVANDRRQVLRNTNLADADRLSGIRQERLSSRLEYSYAGGDYFRLRGGLEHLREGVVFGFENTDTDKSFQNIASPYLEVQQRFGPLGLTAGLRYSAYLDLNESDIWEPRFLLNYYAGKSIFHLSAERSSRLPFTGSSPEDISNAVVATNQLGLGWQYALANGDAFSANAYYQESPDDYGNEILFINGERLIFHFNSLLGGSQFFFGNRISDFRSYGLELSYQRPIQAEQLYYTANLSVFRAENQNGQGDWVRGRFSRDFIFQGVAGKEWEGRNKKGKARAFGANVSLILAGGERFYPVDAATSAEDFVAEGVTVYDFLAERTDQMDTYFRPDLRLYRRKYHRKTTTTLALDIQNLSGRANVAYRYYDHVTEQTEDRLQLGIIPVLSYRIEWR
jgi:hypothetical protein